MIRRVLVLAAVACVLGSTPTFAAPPADVDVTVDQNRPYVGVGVTVNNFPVGASVDGERRRACAGYGDTTGICTDQVTDRVWELIDLG